MDEAKNATAAAQHAVIATREIGEAQVRAYLQLIGGSLVFASMQSDPTEARGLGTLLQGILGQPYGQVLLGAMATGFMAYGVYELSRASYRRVRTG